MATSEAPPLGWERSGFDAWRVVFHDPKTGDEHEAPALMRRAIPIVVARFERHGLTALRAYRLPNGCAGGGYEAQPLGLNGEPINEEVAA